MKETKNRSIYYPDIWIFLIAIPLINTINYYLTYSGIHFNFFLLITFTIDTVQGYIAWAAVRKIIIYLDRRIPYFPNPVKRILVQLFITTVAGLLIIALTTELISRIARKRPAPSDFYAMDLLIIGIWFFVINGVYIGLYLYRQWIKAEHDKKTGKNAVESLPVRIGNQNILVRFEDIMLFCIEGDYVQLVQKNTKTYYCDQSLDKLEKMLPQAYFFRINRQFIMHRQAINGIRRIENGKLLVVSTLLSDNVPELVVSRTKARTFKEWLLSSS